MKESPTISVDRSSPAFGKAHFPTAAVTSPVSVEECSLHHELSQLVSASASRPALLTSIVDLLQRLTNAQVVAYFQADDGASLLAGPQATSPTWNPAVENYVDGMPNWAEAARRQQRVVQHSFGAGWVAIAVPVIVSDCQTDACCAIVRLGGQTMESVSVAFQWVIGHVTLWHARQASRELDCEAANSAALLELIADVARSTTVAAAAQVLVEASCKYLGSDRVALGLVAPGARLCRLAAVSGVTGIDPQASLSNQLEAVLNESLLRETPGHWPPAEADRHLLSAHRQLSDACGGSQVFSARLCDATGTPVGVWAFVGNKDSLLDSSRAGFLRVCTAEIGTLLALVRRSEQSTAVGKLFDRLSPTRLPRSKMLELTLAILAACLAFPLPYRISCDCLLEPVVRRFVAAPYDGLFEKSLVKPGDVVRRDQVLGRLDGREVRVEMAGLAADQSRAAKSRDVNMAAGKIAAAQIDKLEMERLDHKKRLLTRRLEHLEIKSPVDGMVISGDLQRSEGVPVSVGQVLYEVAPLDRMVAEVAIADPDRSFATAQQSVALKLDAFPGSSWSGSLARINPRAELRDEHNVFIGEVLLDNADGTLRPGMKGKAKIEGDHYPLVWIILHKPWNTILGWMGW